MSNKYRPEGRCYLGMTMIFWWRVFDLEFARNNELYEPTGPAVTKIDQLGVGLK